MSVLYLLIGASLFLAIVFVVAFVMSVRSGQFDDDFTPSVRILFENSPKSSSRKNKS